MADSVRRSHRGAVASVSAALASALLIGILAAAPARVRAAPPDTTEVAPPASADTVAAPVLPIPLATLEAPPVPSAPGEPVYLGGRVLLRMRDPRGYESPRARAVALRKRLDVVIRNRADGPTALQAMWVDSVAVILAGDTSILTISPRDLAPGDRRTTIEVARALLPELREGIARERRQLAPLRVLTSIGLSLVLVLAFVVAARIAARTWRRAAPAVRTRVAAVVPGLRVRGIEILSAERAAGLGERVTGLALLVAGVALGYLTLSLIFSFFPWTQGWSHQLLAFAFQSIAGGVAAIAGALPGLVLAVAVLYAFHLAIHFLGSVMDRAGAGLLTIPGLHPELARPTKQLLRVALWVAAVIIVYPLIPGSQSAAFRGVSILLGLVVSLGSVGLVDNLLAGLILTYARSFRIGERIRAGDVSGDVVALGLLTTKVRTIKNEEVTLGNSQVLRGSVMNYSRLAAEGEGLILHTSVTIGYDAPWRKVHELLIEAALATEGIDPEPRPFVLQRSLDDFFVTYEVNAYTKRPREMLSLYGLLHQNIQDCFNRAGVEIMSPHYSSLRDGNTVTIPEEKRPRGYRAGAFRVERREPGP